MWCEYCGSEIPDDAAVCGFCFATLKPETGVPVGEPRSVSESGEVETPAETAQAAEHAASPEGTAAPSDLKEPLKPPEEVPRPAPTPKKGGKSRLPIIVIAVVAIVAIAIGAFAFGGGAGASVPKEAKEAMRDAAQFAGELASRYESYAPVADSGNANADGETRTYEIAAAEIEEGIARVDADIAALKGASISWEGYDQALAAMVNLEGALKYEKDILEAQNNAADVEGTGTGAAMETIAKLYDNYQAIDAPDFLKPYLSNTIETLPTIYAALQYSTASASTLATYTSAELLTWWFTKQTAYDSEGNTILIKECQESEKMLDALANGEKPATKPSVEIDAISEIAPNLYPSLDSAVNLGVVSYDSSHSIMVSVEIPGLSQKAEQKFDLPQGYSFLPIKPALLTDLDVSKLENNSTTQIDVKVTDADSGEVLAQESKPVDLLSMYDFTWTNDEFGSTAAFDILAWLRPHADEVAAINRSAADFMGKWTNGKYTSIAGYQYGNDVTATLIQCAAIQAAISQAGVVYVMDAYSFTSDQHVLTPDAVVQKKQGLCIETSLLMASCLMAANMHPLIIITPGHAQVAVETYSGSGNYFLLETTVLPYSGVNTKYSATQGAFYNGLLASTKTKTGDVYYWTTSGSSEEWQTYFKSVADGSDEFGGVFVIDCALQRVMDIQGLENI